MSNSPDVEGMIRRRVAQLRSTARLPDLESARAEHRRVRAGTTLLGSAPLLASSIVALVVVAIALAGGRASEQGARVETFVLPHTGAPRSGDVVVCNDALMVGQLHGDPADPRVAWVVGDRGRRTDVNWPPDVHAEFAPGLRLVRGDQVIAREGDVVRLGGGFGMTSAFDACEIKVPG